MRSFDCGETGSIDTSIGYDSPTSVGVIIPSGLFVESFEQVRGSYRSVASNIHYCITSVPPNLRLIGEMMNTCTYEDLFYLVDEGSGLRIK